MPGPDVVILSAARTPINQVRRIVPRTSTRRSWAQWRARGGRAGLTAADVAKS
jgi:hypothetical protein